MMKKNINDEIKEMEERIEFLKYKNERENEIPKYSREPQNDHWGEPIIKETNKKDVENFGIVIFVIISLLIINLALSSIILYWIQKIG